MDEPISAQKNDDVDIFEKETKLVFDDNQVASEVLKTSRDKCSICKIGDLKPGAGSGQALGTGWWCAGPATVSVTRTTRVSGYMRTML